MNSFYNYNQDNENDDNKQTKIAPQYSSIYMITHMILSFFAIYLSWRCSNGVFSPINFLFAFCCPHLYIIWALATRGGCGIFEGLPVAKPFPLLN